jgi:hypothetical protein
MSHVEPWLRGPVEGVIPALQPVAHSLTYAREQLEKLLPALTAEQVWQRPGNAAPIAYHVRHAMGSIDRMLTYLHGQQLSDEQFEQLKAEKDERRELDGVALLQNAQSVIDRAIDVIRNTREDELDAPREVGRKRLPTDVRGLLFEIAVHTARHIGQVATTARLVA